LRTRVKIAKNEPSVDPDLSTVSFNFSKDLQRGTQSIFIILTDSNAFLSSVM